MTKSIMLALMLLPALTVGCADRRANTSLDALAKAPLQAGIGLGPLKLGQTTLGSVTRGFNVEDAAITTDQNAVRVDFLRQGLSLAFQGSVACVEGVMQRIMANANQQQMSEFFLSKPECETMLLESIAAYVPSVGDPFYEGVTVEGVGLNAARELAELRYKHTQAVLHSIETGEPMPDIPPPNPSELKHPGIRLTLGRDAEGREVVKRIEVIRY